MQNLEILGYATQIARQTIGAAPRGLVVGLVQRVLSSCDDISRGEGNVEQFRTLYAELREMEEQVEPRITADGPAGNRAQWQYVITALHVARMASHILCAMKANGTPEGTTGAFLLSSLISVATCISQIDRTL